MKYRFNFLWVIWVSSCIEKKKKKYIGSLLWSVNSIFFGSIKIRLLHTKEKRMKKFSTPVYRCDFHPSQAIVGICSSCLRDRLVKLARANSEQRRSEIVYTPDPSSWGYLRFKRKNYDDAEVIQEPDTNSSRITTSKSELSYNGSDKKKARNVRFSGFRSFLGFLRKRACRNNVCVRGRLEDGMQRPQDRSGYVQDSWIPKTKSGCPSSTRRSVSERRWTTRGYTEDPTLRRSTSGYIEREMIGRQEEIEGTLDSEGDCETTVKNIRES